MMKWFLTLTEVTETVVEEAATQTELTQLPLFTKGLLTTAMGLLGVFLVLGLFFVTIKLMQKIGTKNAQ